MLSSDWHSQKSFAVLQLKRSVAVLAESSHKRLASRGKEQLHAFKHPRSQPCLNVTSCSHVQKSVRWLRCAPPVTERAVASALLKPQQRVLVFELCVNSLKVVVGLSG
jgi:hypothetical protein